MPATYFQLCSFLKKISLIERYNLGITPTILSWNSLNMVLFAKLLRLIGLKSPKFFTISFLGISTKLVWEIYLKPPACRRKVLSCWWCPSYKSPNLTKNTALKKSSGPLTLPLFSDKKSFSLLPWFIFFPSLHSVLE